jgi:glycosyltransferase involved in cell wall biosynthesis
MNIIVLDEHPLEDGRVGRHLTYLLRHYRHVFRLHFSIFAPALNPGHFSLYGEKGYRITPPSPKRRVLNFLVFNTMYFMPSLFASRIEEALKEMDVDLTVPTVLHIHDPCLLKVAMMMKKNLFKSARIVYDRHEFYEIFGTKARLPIPTRDRLYETIARDRIDGVAHASLGGRSDLGSLFPGAGHTHIPNFPLADTYNEAHILEKVRSFGSDSAISVLYIGSLSPLDRDVRLLLKVASDILDSNSKTTFYIGGPSFGHDEELGQMMELLREKYGLRFRFHLGFVPRDQTRHLTEDCHIGLHFIKPETTYWVKGSPNKLFEYLRCGAIPVVRASIEFSDDIAPCSLLFDRYSPEEEIVSHIRQLLADPDECRRMMENALMLGSKFTFEAVGPNYLNLYDQIWNGHPSVL